MCYSEHALPFLQRHAWRFGAILPNATVHDVPGAGHAAKIDEPEWFVAALREFLDTTTSDLPSDRTVDRMPDEPN